MPQDIIELIKETEQKADSVIEDAKIRAREILAEAASRAEDECKAIFERCRASSEISEREASLRGKQQGDAIIDEAKKQCAELKKLGASRVTKAAALIAERVVSD